jgi:hypothetical protein
VTNTALTPLAAHQASRAEQHNSRQQLTDQAFSNTAQSHQDLHVLHMHFNNFNTKLLLLHNINCCCLKTAAFLAHCPLMPSHGTSQKQWHFVHTMLHDAVHNVVVITACRTTYMPNTN